MKYCEIYWNVTQRHDVRKCIWKNDANRLERSEKAMAPHSSTLAWKIPWMEDPGRLQSMGSLRVRHDWVTSLSLSCIGERNGSPLQYSCLENPRDRGAWWAAVYGVAQSWTRLKRLSSSSSSNLGFLSRDKLICWKRKVELWFMYSEVVTSLWKGKSAAASAKSLQSCLTLCDPIDGSPPGSPVPGILQARTLEWVAISFSNAWKWKMKVKSLSRVQLLATPWTAAYQAPPSMGFAGQEYWSGSLSMVDHKSQWILTDLQNAWGTF